MKKLPKLVHIEWHDSRQPISCWQHLSDFKAHPVVLCHTVGYIIKDGKKNKAIAQSISDVNLDEIQVMGVMHIPTRCIVKITTLELKK